MKRLILIIAAAALLTGCSTLDGYSRSYSFSYTDAEGRELRTGLKLDPTGYKK